MERPARVPLLMMSPVTFKLRVWPARRVLAFIGSAFAVGAAEKISQGKM